jgi:hypothetical protein
LAIQDGTPGSGLVRSRLFAGVASEQKIDAKGNDICASVKLDREIDTSIHANKNGIQD